jgi:hypothetical protein
MARGLIHVLALALLGCSACFGTVPPAQTPPSSPPVAVEETPPPPVESSRTQREPNPGDDPQISRSAGPEGGVVVLWPRIIGNTGAADNTELARGLQARMRSLVEETLPGHEIEVRPEPERTCPQAGCAAISANVLLLRESDGCVILALVSPPGRSPMTLVPWVGEVELDASSSPFREPPEERVRIRDFAYCEDLLSRSDERQSEVADALRAAAGTH